MSVRVEPTSTGATVRSSGTVTGRVETAPPRSVTARLLDEAGVWMIVGAVLAALNLGIPALVGVVLGGAR